MIRQRFIYRAIIAHYTGAPVMKFYLDGDLKDTITLPDNSTKFKTKIITLPVGRIGYIPHVTSSSADKTDFDVITDDMALYERQVVWHYYNITYSGTVNVSLYIDEVLHVGDGDDASAATDKKTLTTTKAQETTKVYLPALSYGRVPHVVNDTSDTGDIIKWTPVALPARFYKTLEGVSEGQITYKGNCFVCFYMDGEKIGTEYQFDDVKDDSGVSKYVSEKFYIEGGAIGNVFQYYQLSGDGDIVALETDAHRVDREEPTVDVTDKQNYG